MKGFVKYLQCLLSRFLWANSEQFHPCVYVLLLWPVHNTLHAEIPLVEALPDSGSVGEYTGCKFLSWNERSYSIKPVWSHLNREGNYSSSLRAMAYIKHRHGTIKATHVRGVIRPLTEGFPLFVLCLRSSLYWPSHTPCLQSSSLVVSPLDACSSSSPTWPPSSSFLSTSTSRYSSALG